MILFVLCLTRGFGSKATEIVSYCMEYKWWKQLLPCDFLLIYQIIGAVGMIQTELLKKPSFMFPCIFLVKRVIDALQSTFVIVNDGNMLHYLNLSINYVNGCHCKIKLQHNCPQQMNRNSVHSVNKLNGYYSLKCCRTHSFVGDNRYNKMHSQKRTQSNFDNRKF